MTLQSGTDQECRVERFETMCRWRRTEEPFSVDERRDYSARAIVEIDGAELGTSSGEVCDDMIVFFGLARAGRIHEASTRADDIGGAHQQRQLIARERRQIALMPAPSDIGVPP